jgi:hypothetical protein
VLSGSVGRKVVARRVSVECLYWESIFNKGSFFF